MKGILVRAGSKLQLLQLESGGHNGGQKGACAMEAAHLLAGDEGWSTDVECMDDSLQSLQISLNDWTDDETRQQLWKYLLRSLNTSVDVEPDFVPTATNQLRAFFYDTTSDVDVLSEDWNTLLGRITKLGNDKEWEAVFFALGTFLPEEREEGLEDLDWERLLKHVKTEEITDDFVVTSV